MPETKKPKKVIKSAVSIHDRTQVETVFSYHLNAADLGQKKSSEHKYRVDAFLFFPVQTGVTQNNYSRQQFYNDLRSFIRLREPRLSFKELAGEGTTLASKQSPLIFVRNFIKTHRVHAGFGTINLATEEARVFGCAYVSYFWRRIERRVNRLKFLQTALRHSDALERRQLSDRFADNTLKFFNKGHQLVRAWRSLYEQGKKDSPELLAPLLYEMELVNEYCTYCFRDGLLKVLKTIDEYGEILDPVSFLRLRKKIVAYLRLERLYAKRHNFSWVYDDSEKVQKENYVYRRGALKRRIWSVLYLNPRTELIFKFQKQIGPMIAAGLAASWAAIASIFIGLPAASNGMRFIGALSMGSMALIVAILVFSYILKDRIKELGRSWFERGLFRSRPDLSNSIYYTNASGQKLKIGEMKELVDFEKSDKIPKKIIELRKANLQKYYKFEDAYGAVIHYKKFISLWPEELKKLNQPLKAVHDIIRLNISSFLVRLDDPLHIALAPTRSHKAVEVMMPKVYHLDFILKYSPLGDSKEHTGSEVIDYYRIVIDKKGMARIEQLK